MIFLLLVLYPVTEIWLTAKFIGEYGWVNFLFMGLVTLMLGRLAWQGSRAKMAASVLAMQRKESHAIAKFLQPALSVLGSILLFLPGILGDCIGFLLVFPPTGFLISRIFEGYFKEKIKSGAWQVGGSGIIFQAQTRGPSRARPTASDIIDVESRPIRDVQAISPSDEDPTKPN